MNKRNKLGAEDQICRLPAAWMSAGISVWFAAALWYIHSWADWRKLLLLQTFPSWSVTPAAALIHVEQLIALFSLTITLLGSGHILLNIFSVKTNNWWEEIAVSFGLGYGFLGTSLFLMGLLGLWSKTGLLVFGIIVFLGSLIPFTRLLQKRSTSPAFTSTHHRAFTLIAGILFWASWLYRLRYAMVPETFYDALEYHLGLPNLYLLSRRIIPTPENSFAGIPSLPSMLYGWTLAWDQWGIAAAMLHGSFVLWIGAALLGLSRRLGRPEAGLYACAIFALTPVVAVESFRTSVGLEWTLLQLLCFTGFLAVVESVPRSSERRKWVVLCGTFLGLTMATKYPAWLLPTAFVPALLFLKFDGVRTDSSSQISFRDAALLLGTALLWLSPWVIKNIVFYGNPIYPFFHERFAPTALYMPDWKQVSAAGTNPFHVLFSIDGLKSYFVNIWSLFKSRDLSESVGPLYFLLIPFVFLVRLPRNTRLWAWLCLGSWAPLSLLSTLSRYFIPHLAGFALLGSLMIVEIRPIRLRAIFLIVMSAALALTGVLWLLLDVPQRMKQNVFSGRISYDQFLGHSTVSYPTPVFAGIEYINAHTQPGAKVLLFGEARNFYLRRAFIAATLDQAAILQIWANDSQDGRSLHKHFLSQGVTHVLVNHGEIARLKASLRFSPRGKASLDDFWAHYTRKAFEIREFPDRWVVVYDVLSEEEAARPHPVDELFSGYSQMGKGF